MVPSWKRTILALGFGLILFSPSIYAQSPAVGEFDELEVGGNPSDIFTDFSQDIEAGKILEDERFYKYGRFFSFQVGFGVTEFTGNRGLAYENEPPTMGFSFLYFFSFRSAFSLGFSLSKHHFLLEDKVAAFDTGPVGLVETNMFRVHAGFRYYLDTTDLGTALTYSNPYLTFRMEYWLQTNKYIDQSTVPDESGGAFGTSVGFGLEFPITLKESYINVEFLYHVVNFFDKYTTSYRPVAGSTAGFDDLDGDVISSMVSYVLSW